MEKTRQTDNDIATEPYEGPGRAITSAGYIYVSHLLSMIAGFFAVGALGAIAHTRTNVIKQWAEKLSIPNAESGAVTQTIAKAVKFASNFAEKISEKFFNILQKHVGSFRNKSMGEEKMAAFLFAGGFGAVFGYVASTFWALFKGTHEGNKGKHQFERAQEEIKSLRATNNTLQTTNTSLQAKLEATASDDLRVAPDAPKFQPPAQKPMLTDADKPATQHLSNVQQDGKIAAEEQLLKA